MNIHHTERVSRTGNEQAPSVNPEEARAILDARQRIAAMRDKSGEVIVDYATGITPDGLLVSVGLNHASLFTVHSAPISELERGAVLTEEKVSPYGEELQAYHARNGEGFVTTAVGEISVPSDYDRTQGRLPTLDEKTLFPIAENGQPFEPENFIPRGVE